MLTIAFKTCKQFPCLKRELFKDAMSISILFQAESQRSAIEREAGELFEYVLIFFKYNDLYWL